ncbi:hypothetical protein BaRGS_00001586 [Batillaria attramentaria]|uniref:Complex 1 LYR protein domain-containing protein n=1 Tax=Batillaria attramentaria TaxID=370345 RepID=A0ABD0M8E3_9CAEN
MLTWIREVFLVTAVPPPACRPANVTENSENDSRVPPGHTLIFSPILISLCQFSVVKCNCICSEDGRTPPRLLSRTVTQSDSDSGVSSARVTEASTEVVVTELISDPPVIVGDTEPAELRTEPQRWSTSAMAYRERVLALYRQVFRLARNWQSASGQASETKEERSYIISEARQLFRKNKSVTDEAAIKEHIRECEMRIELALHYGIPYPRPVNIPQSTLPPTSARLKKAQKRSIQQSKPVYMKSYDDLKE